jgi:hypothetical protein
MEGVNLTKVHCEEFSQWETMHGRDRARDETKNLNVVDVLTI